MARSFFSDNDDLRFYFDRGIDWKSLVEVTERGFDPADGFADADEAVGFYRDIAEMVGEFVANEVAPVVPAIDRTGVTLVDGEVQFPRELQTIFDGIKRLELHGMCLPRELGGMNCPLLLYFINAEMLARADVSVMTHHSFHGGMMMAMLVLSMYEGSTEAAGPRLKIVKSRFEEAMREIAAGEAWGCMDITEPDAGSDMAALRTTGTVDADGNWTVSGEKIFVTSGHGKYHFVIARTEKSQPGDDLGKRLGGLSMFLVPTYRDGAGGRERLARIERVEEKLGHHGSATCAVTFDQTPAHLIGNRGEGFKYMLLLMNNARVGVGFEAIGLCQAAHELAAGYAAERMSMGKTLDQHELIADYLDEMRTDIQGLRAMAVDAAFCEEMSQKLRIAELLGTNGEGANTTDRDYYRARARRLTPLLKYLAAEKAVEMARRCVQIHGGNGYTREYGAEKLLRDAMVMPIYEGTSQIQSLMAMKDTMSAIIANPQGFVRRLAQARWRALSARDPLERRVFRLVQLSLSAQQHLITRTVTSKVKSLQGVPLTRWPAALRNNWDPKRDFGFALLHAERLTRLLADEAICEVLLNQAAVHADRRELLERYVERAEPRCRFLHDAITSTGERLLGAMAGGEEAERTAS